MSGFHQRPRVAALLRASGVHSLVERYQREHEQRQADPRPGSGWAAVLHGSRLSLVYPGLVALLAVISASSGLYPFGPVLVAAVVFAPERWRSTYLAACLGSAGGAALLAQTVQYLGGDLVAQYFPGLDHSAEWMAAERWVTTHGPVALAGIAALPLPQIPPLLILALAGTPPTLIGLAIFAGKLCKYGVYILIVQLLLKAIRLGLHKLPQQD